MSDENEEPVRPASSSRIAQRVPRTAGSWESCAESAGRRPAPGVSPPLPISFYCCRRFARLRLSHRRTPRTPHARIRTMPIGIDAWKQTTWSQYDRRKKAECLRTVLRWHIITVALAFCDCTIVTAAPSNTICARHRNVRCVESSRCQLAPTAARHTFDNITCGPCEGNVSRATIVICRTHRRAPPCIARALVRR